MVFLFFYYAVEFVVLAAGCKASRALRSFSGVGLRLRRISRDTTVFKPLRATFLLVSVCPLTYGMQDVPVKPVSLNKELVKRQFEFLKFVNEGNICQVRQYIVENKVDVNARIPRGVPGVDESFSGMSALYIALFRKNTAMVTMLLAAGASVDTPNNFKVPPLRVALLLALHDQITTDAELAPRLQTIEALIAFGADYNAQSWTYKETIFHQIANALKSDATGVVGKIFDHIVSSIATHPEFIKKARAQLSADLIAYEQLSQACMWKLVEIFNSKNKDGKSADQLACKGNCKEAAWGGIKHDAKCPGHLLSPDYLKKFFEKLTTE